MKCRICDRPTLPKADKTQPSEKVVFPKSENEWGFFFLHPLKPTDLCWYHTKWDRFGQLRPHLTRKHWRN